MTYSICLDQYSNNFNVNNLSSNGFSIYTNLDYNNPIASGIPYQDLFSPPVGNCSLTINLPPGATQILVIDNCTSFPTNIAPIFAPTTDAGTLVTSCCYALINVDNPPLSWCDTCNLNFDVFSSSYVGQIVAGNLTSTCGSVTDYTIGWYLNGNYSSPGFISGYGTAFSPYSFTHPLTGSAAVPVLAGNWEGIIHDIAINGVTYSSISGSAGGVSIPFSSCFDTVVVSPLSCGNGTFPGKYSHHFNFNSQAIGATPAPVSLTYQLSPSTKYFALAFKGKSIYDEIEIRWKSGDPSTTSDPTLYSQPIYLEKLQIGSDVPGGYGAPQSLYSSTFNSVSYNPTISNINNLWPKTAPMDGWWQKVLTLTNLSSSTNPSLPDTLEITITPNPNNNNTQWDAGFQCLDTFDCTDCTWDNYPNNLPKIYKLELVKFHGCDRQQLKMHISGCISYSDWAGDSVFLSTFGINNPYINYIGSLNNHFQTVAGIVPNFTEIISIPSSFQSMTPSTLCLSTPGNTGTGGCASPSTGTITFTKTLQQIKLEFNTLSDYLHYKNNLANTVYNTGLSSSTPIPCQINGILNPWYYTILIIRIPYSTSPSANCGDNSTMLTYAFNSNDQLNVTYVDIPALNYYSITIPQTPLVNCESYQNCNSCFNTINSLIQNYNTSINTPSNFSFVTNVGSKYNLPFKHDNFSVSTIPGMSGSYCYNAGNGGQRYTWYNINTIPFISSSNGWVNLPSLGATLPCSTIPYPYIDADQATGAFFKGIDTKYNVVFPHMTSSFNYSLSTNDFKIYAQTGTGATGSALTTNPYDPCPYPTAPLIYSYIGGVATMHTSSYFQGGVTPTLIIAP
jgi:hypothetical protein